MKTFFKVTNKTLLLASFLIPCFILVTIYALLGTYPFGTGSLLTIDLGQQYVDFFSYYRHTILEDPQALFYSFSKSIGGDMLGLWAYYLTSPFNLIFLFVNKYQLATAVTIQILVKLSFCSMSMCYLLQKLKPHAPVANLVFALSYGLMSYLTVNQFNVMWLDGMIWLPIVIYGLDCLIKDKNPLYYIIPLSITVFSNYYIGYMICIFLVFFFFYLLLSQENALPPRQALWAFIRFAGYSLLSMGLISFLLVPTFYSLIGGKASYSKWQWVWTLDYNPLELLSKIYFGCFDFDQMPDGLPNIFVGSIASLSFIAYFFSSKFKWKEKIYALLLTIFLLVSMNVEWLNKLWHAGQFPIWYPYRFSFVFCFMVVYIAHRWYTSNDYFKQWLIIPILVILVGNTYYYISHPVSYLEPWQLCIGLSFTGLALLLILCKNSPLKHIRYCLLVFVIFEMGLNSYVNLTRLSYVSQTSFVTYQQMLDSWAKVVRPKEGQFYRVEKTFQRSKGDAMQSPIYGLNHFASTLEKELPTLFGSLGISESNGFISYSNGTMFTDSFFDILYMIEDNQTIANPYTKDQKPFPIHEYWTRKDLNYYQKITHQTQATIYKNPFAWSLAFPIDSSVKEQHFEVNKPIKNQELLATLLGNGKTPLFSFEGYRISYENVSVSTIENSHRLLYKKIDPDKEAKIIIEFTPISTDPYYIVLDGQLRKDDFSLKLNDEKYYYYNSFRHNAVMNLTSQTLDLQKFEITLEKASFTMDKPELYRFNVEEFKKLHHTIQPQLMQMDNFTETAFTGHATITKDSSMLTTIPYSKGWQVLVDGKKVDTYPVLDSLLAFDISAGSHSFSYHYHTPYLWQGVMISISSIGILLICLTHYKKRNS
ncbi:Uncharacterized membrane protein YfhO [Granulicatella balaenopterae]|uniref:Uncharacterized membrane protein YfhO n=1 Tax=Granulicatella balaenopterae TaxID=137733 RepID=A0A1H9MPU1_9LACT|nr:YfhO family protein [Granulicatella balaenopterae]SER25658.1 Uncharacterized membrane protein YfhO [Granulicatella balaenopterae]